MKRPALILFLVLSLFSSCTNDGSGEKERLTRLPERTAEEKEREDTLLSELDLLKRDQCMQGATLGYLFLDCSGKEPRIIAEQDPSKPLIPASTLKLFVTGAALDLYGKPIVPEITVTNLNSINWRSSRIMRRIGGTVYQKSTNAAGARAVIEFWKSKGVDTRGMYLDDGNGLSRNNAISPRQLVDALFVAQRSPYFRYFYESLPLSGLTGTLKKAMKGTPAQGRIRAKTGTIASVKSFAGYAHTLSGKKVIFAIIVNGFYCRPKVIKKKLEAVLVRMAEI
jgi:D-alanyl-D-alanine carboxypeptidase